MELVKLIYTIIIEFSNGIQINEMKVIDGVKSFIIENDLEKEYKKLLDKNAAEKIIRLYLQPITSLPADTMVAYFENYSLINAFNALSNESFKLAEMKKTGRIINVATICNLKSRYEEITDALLDDATLMKSLESEISEVALDIAYIAGESNKTSLRIGELVQI